MNAHTLPVPEGLTAVPQNITNYRGASQTVWLVSEGDRFLGTLSLTYTGSEPTYGWDDALLGGWNWNVLAVEMMSLWKNRLAVSDAELAPLGSAKKAAELACRNPGDAWEERITAKYKAIAACRNLLDCAV